MAPYYGPDESEATIQTERFFLAGDIACGVGYGIQLVLYYSCAMYLWNRRKQSNKSLFLLAYITVLLSVSTIFVIVQARTVQLMYVDNRNYPGGPFEFFLATQNWAVNVMFDASLFVLTFLSDCLMLWRCWVIWTSSGKLVAYLITAFPAITLLASFAMGTLWTLESTHPGLSFYSKLPLAVGTSYYAISLGVNIILTILITGRLLVYRKQILDSLPADHARGYVSLLTIVVESAAIYSVCALIFLITYAVENPANQVLMFISCAAQQIVSYLIIYRLADGRAWRKDTLYAMSARSRGEKSGMAPDGKREGFNNNGAHHLSTFHAATVGLVLSQDHDQTTSSNTVGIHGGKEEGHSSQTDSHIFSAV
ncbi:hypothetical protein D9757_008387 [Collybiopsis confluens]|uniref:Uncharacterized protein n=1 Tax=Collybiopsis confluens TaxID=2823264 RepID=A0A8H5LLK1_9AGAR|nr:hypothetical protein D9757_012072 [Collybiopsis confluens]KAF5383332.1 hypothetical protein D9757_008387 [Collybiopsis confluens]